MLVTVVCAYSIITRSEFLLKYLNPVFVDVSHHSTTSDLDESMEQPNKSQPGACITGEIVCWLHRTEAGSITMGWIYPEGRFDLIEVAENVRPRELLGETITAKPVGWFSGASNGSVEFHVPAKTGTYALVDQ